VARAAESPSWSPDGRWIAYDGYGPDSIATDICLVRPDGKGRKQLTHTLSDNRAPAWSPDATLIVYEQDAFFGHDTDLYVVSVNGGPERQAVSFNWPQNTPSWQPVR
jgi:Tol biopolymer transport system component